jgi:hypothetical protein
MAGHGKADVAWRIAGHDADKFQRELWFGRQRQRQRQPVVNVGTGNAVAGITINNQTHSSYLNQ